MTLQARLYRNNLTALERIARIRPSSTTNRTNRWLMIAAGVAEVPAFNVAVPLANALVGDDAAAVIGWYDRRSLPYRVRLRAEQDGDALERLVGLGFEPERTETAYVLEQFPSGTTQPEGLSVRTVTGEQNLRRYGALGWEQVGLADVGVAIARTARELGFELILGLSGDYPVACSMAVVTDDVVGVYNVAVLPEYRRRGFGSRMVEAALAAGSSRGARLAYLSAPEQAASLYSRLGFRPVSQYCSGKFRGPNARRPGPSESC